MSDSMRWYVVHTYSGYENKVATNIEKAVENRKFPLKRSRKSRTTKSAMWSAKFSPVMCWSR